MALKGAIQGGISNIRIYLTGKMQPPEYGKGVTMTLVEVTKIGDAPFRQGERVLVETFAEYVRMILEEGVEMPVGVAHLSEKSAPKVTVPSEDPGDSIEEG